MKYNFAKYNLYKLQTTNHKLQTTNHKPQTTNHKPQTTNYKLQTTNYKPQTTNCKTVNYLQFSCFVKKSFFKLPHTESKLPPSFFLHTFNFSSIFSFLSCFDSSKNCLIKSLSCSKAN